MIFRKALSVDGVSLPRRRFTGWAVVYFLVFFCAPVLGLGLLIDLAFYYVFTGLLGRCYGVLCLFG